MHLEHHGNQGDVEQTMGREGRQYMDAVSRTQAPSHSRLHSPLRAQLVVGKHPVEVH